MASAVLPPAVDSSSVLLIEAPIEPPINASKQQRKGEKRPAAVLHPKRKAIPYPAKAPQLPPSSAAVAGHKTQPIASDEDDDDTDIRTPPDSPPPPDPFRFDDNKSSSQSKPKPKLASNKGYGGENLKDYADPNYHPGSSLAIVPKRKRGTPDQITSFSHSPFCLSC